MPAAMPPAALKTLRIPAVVFINAVCSLLQALPRGEVTDKSNVASTSLSDRKTMVEPL
jgi:hypothetical protein